jgi:signal transduction histidine kinase
MSTNTTHLRSLVPAGLVTWALVGVPQVGRLVGTEVSPRGVAWAAAFLGFGVAFWFGSREERSPRSELVLIALQTLFAVACIALEPIGFQPVLLVIVAVQLGAIPTIHALAWIVAQTAVLGVVLVRAGTNLPLGMTLAYFGFQLFGIFVTRIAHHEHAAKQALAETNAELRVATGLLEISSRNDERLRIARDLHDLMGHHLTALSLNLEVASHLTEGPARDSIEKSRALTRVLLADVREVVGKLRDREPVDLRSALASLRKTVQSPALLIDGDDVLVPDPEVARTLLRVIQEIVTNAIRHSGARQLRLSLSQNGNGINLLARDDGAGTDFVDFGSGLKGMKERVEEAGGSLEVASSRGGGFELRIALPMQERES